MNERLSVKAPIRADRLSAQVSRAAAPPIPILSRVWKPGSHLPGLRAQSSSKLTLARGRQGFRQIIHFRASNLALAGKAGKYGHCLGLGGAASGASRRG